MKKSIIALMGLFTLVACSEDSYQEADKMNKNSTTENAGSQNSVRTVNTNIASPYNINMFGNSINYDFLNSTPFTYEITPYIGLAYYDAADDAFYNNPNLASAIDLHSGDYSNIFAGNTEYLNLIKGSTLIVAPGTKSESGNHCPVLSGEVFDVTVSGASADEATLLSNAGKVYYYDVVVKAGGGAVLASFTSKQLFQPFLTATPTTSFNSWNYLGFIAPSPFVEMFYNDTGSMEIVSGNNFVPGAANNYTSITVSGTKYDFWYYGTSGSSIVTFN